MTALVSREDAPLAAAFAAVASAQATDGRWIRDLRQRAFERFAELGLPTRAHEDWRYTSLAALADDALRLPARTPNARGLAYDRVASLGLGAALEDEAIRLVLWDGEYVASLSRPGGLPPGAFAGSLRNALESRPTLVRRHLANGIERSDDSLLALNTAFISDGLFISLPPDTPLSTPIHLLVVSTGAPQTVTFPRLLILVDKQSQATVLESYVDLAKGTHVTNAVTEIVVGEGARLSHVRLEYEDAQATHLGFLEARLAANAELSTHNLSFGGALGRLSSSVDLGGPGGRCRLRGLNLGRGERHADSRVLVRHAVPDCHSEQLYKSVLDDDASSIFNGKVVVEEHAQKSDASQKSASLLLSERATANTRPQLEIYADDVKCSHGATVGKLDEDQLYYLRSRGIGPEEARRELTAAFACDVIDSIGEEPVRRLVAGLFRRELEAPAEEIPSV